MRASEGCRPCRAQDGTGSPGGCSKSSDYVLLPDHHPLDRAVDTAAVHSWNTRNVPRRFALLAGFVMVGAWAKASTKCGFATKQAARQPLKRAKARPMSE